jgi:hypothetical protein
MTRVELNKDRLDLPNSIHPAKTANPGIARAVLAADAIQDSRGQQAQIRLHVSSNRSRFMDAPEFPRINR